MNSRSLLICATLIIATAIGGYHYFAETPARNAPDQLAQLLAKYSPISPLDERAKVSDCKVNGPYPDHACTPGAILSDATTGTICVSGYSKSVRNVTASTKKKIYEAYGYAYPQARGLFEADHLIPLELGGSNEIANLFPEIDDSGYGYHQKDLVENYLHHEVCAGRADLRAAQHQIADDWVAVYKTLTPEQIEELKREFAFN